MSHASIDRILACPSLPTLPVVALRVLELTAKRDVSLRELASVIENDPAIATKVLRTVNSSYYSLSRRCGSIQQALVFRELKQLIIRHAAPQKITQPSRHFVLIQDSLRLIRFRIRFFPKEKLGRHQHRLHGDEKTILIGFFVLSYGLFDQRRKAIDFGVRHWTTECSIQDRSQHGSGC